MRDILGASYSFNDSMNINNLHEESKFSVRDESKDVSSPFYKLHKQTDFDKSATFTNSPMYSTLKKPRLSMSMASMNQSSGIAIVSPNNKKLVRNNSNTMSTNSLINPAFHLSHSNSNSMFLKSPNFHNNYNKNSLSTPNFNNSTFQGNSFANNINEAKHIYYAHYNGLEVNITN